MRYPTILMSARGDPGIFSGVGRALRSVARVGAQLLPGPAGMVARQLTRGGTPGTMPRFGPQAGPGGVIPTPGFRGGLQRALPGGASGYTTGKCVTKDGRPRRIKQNGDCWKRPAMNAANPRAARRAIARLKGTRKLLRSIEAAMPKVQAKAKGKRCGCK